jgi:branched-chain amino acid transport system substrate-binding protein
MRQQKFRWLMAMMLGLALAGCGEQGAAPEAGNTPDSQSEAPAPADGMDEAEVGNSSKMPSPFRVAIAGPESGPVAQYGEMQFTGALMAVERMNEAGGINGRPIEVSIFDDACEPKQATAVANRIVNEGYRIVIGHLCSGSTQPASDIYEDEGILMVTPASTNPDITNRGHQMVFRTIGLDSQQGPTAADYIINELEDARTIAIIHDKQQYGEGLATAVREALEAAGREVAFFEGITTGEKDFTALIDKLKSEKVDLLYYGGYHPELGLILRQSAEKSFRPVFMGPEGVGNKDLNAIAGEAAEGLLVTLPKAFDQDPDNQAIVEAIKALGKDASGPFVFTSYAALEVIRQAAEATGSDDPEVLAHNMRRNSFETSIGKLSFKENGDLKKFKFELFEWHADASRTPVGKGD